MKDNLRDIEELIARYEREQDRARSQAPTDSDIPQTPIETVRATIAQRTQRNEADIYREIVAAYRKQEAEIARMKAQRETAMAA